MERTVKNSKNEEAPFENTMGRIGRTERAERMEGTTEDTRIEKKEKEKDKNTKLTKTQNTRKETITPVLLFSHKRGIEREGKRKRGRRMPLVWIG